MKRSLVYLFSAILLAGELSCKNDKSSSENPEEDTSVENSETTEVVAPEKKELTEADKIAISSVLSKAMSTPELKTFVSALVTARLTDMLAGDEGSYTVLAPSNDAFNALSQEKMRSYLNSGNTTQLATLLKNHIVEGNLDSEQIKSGGNQTVTTLSGEELDIKVQGDLITVTDSAGNTANVEKSDLSGSNGVVHILSAVLEGAK